MRCGLVIALALVGCGNSKPDKPSSTPTDANRADLDVFCGPEAAAKATSLRELGPFVEPKLRDGGELKELFVVRLEAGSVTPTELKAGIEKLMQAAHVTSCPTLDALFSPRH